MFILLILLTFPSSYFSSVSSDRGTEDDTPKCATLACGLIWAKDSWRPIDFRKSKRFSSPTVDHRESNFTASSGAAHADILGPLTESQQKVRILTMSVSQMERPMWSSGNKNGESPLFPFLNTD